MAFCAVLGETMRDKKIQPHKILQMTAINYSDIIFGISLELNYGQFQESSTHRENWRDTGGLWSEQRGALVSSHTRVQIPQESVSASCILCSRQIERFQSQQLGLSTRVLPSSSFSDSFPNLTPDSKWAAQPLQKRGVTPSVTHKSELSKYPNLQPSHSWHLRDTNVSNISCGLAETAVPQWDAPDTSLAGFWLWEDLNSLLCHPLGREINTFCELIDWGLWYSKDQVKLDTLNPQCARREPIPTSLGSILQQQYMRKSGFQEFWRLFSGVRRAAPPLQSARPLLLLPCLLKRPPFPQIHDIMLFLTSLLPDLK